MVLNRTYTKRTQKEGSFNIEKIQPKEEGGGNKRRSRTHTNARKMEERKQPASAPSPPFPFSVPRFSRSLSLLSLLLAVSFLPLSLSLSLSLLLRLDPLVLLLAQRGFVLGPPTGINADCSSPLLSRGRVQGKRRTSSSLGWLLSLSLTALG